MKLNMDDIPTFAELNASGFCDFGDYCNGGINDDDFPEPVPESEVGEADESISMSFDTIISTEKQEDVNNRSSTITSQAAFDELFSSLSLTEIHRSNSNMGITDTDDKDSDNEDNDSVIEFSAVVSPSNSSSKMSLDCSESNNTQKSPTSVTSRSVTSHKRRRRRSKDRSSNSIQRSKNSHSDNTNGRAIHRRTTTASDKQAKSKHMGASETLKNCRGHNSSRAGEKYQNLHQRIMACNIKQHHGHRVSKSDIPRNYIEKDLQLIRSPPPKSTSTSRSIREATEGKTKLQHSRSRSRARSRSKAASARKRCSSRAKAKETKNHNEIRTAVLPNGKMQLSKCNNGGNNLKSVKSIRVSHDKIRDKLPDSSKTAISNDDLNTFRITATSGDRKRQLVRSKSVRIASTNGKTNNEKIRDKLVSGGKKTISKDDLSTSRTEATSGERKRQLVRSKSLRVTPMSSRTSKMDT